MKILKAIVVLCVLLTFGHLKAYEPDYTIWKEAHHGNVSLVQKMCLTRKQICLEDVLLRQFALIYVYYRSGNEERMRQVMEGTDSYLETIFPNHY